MTDVTTQAIADFLLARYDEEEGCGARDDERARPAGLERGRYPSGRSLDGPVDGPSGYISIVINPARVLAECEAKRRIVEDIAANYLPDDVPATDGLAGRVLSAFVQPYANHPAFNSEWLLP